MALTERLFIDTGAWYALFDRRDVHHQGARDFFQSLKTRAVRLVTSDYVFDETVTVLRYRAGHRIARAFGEHLHRSQIACEEVDRTTRDVAWQIFVDHEDQDFSFTDCTSFALMRLHGIQDAFGFDRHFLTFGLTLHPSSAR